MWVYPCLAAQLAHAVAPEVAACPTGRFPLCARALTRPVSQSRIGHVVTWKGREKEVSALLAPLLTCGR